MKLYYFSEMPHHEYPDEEGGKYPSLRLAFPNRFFDRDKAASNYQRYLDEYEFADQAGFDGLMRQVSLEVIGKRGGCGVPLIRIVFQCLRDYVVQISAERGFQPRVCGDR